VNDLDPKNGNENENCVNETSSYDGSVELREIFK
jgi:hypothetical protein